MIGNTNISGLSKNEKSQLKDIREEIEDHILSTFDGKEMWFLERFLQVNGIANITTNEWGVVVNFVSEHCEPFRVSGRWDVIIAYKNHLAAQYCGWSLDFECTYPEMGVNT